MWLRFVYLSNSRCDNEPGNQGVVIRPSGIVPRQIGNGCLTHHLDVLVEQEYSILVSIPLDAFGIERKTVISKVFSHTPRKDSNTSASRLWIPHTKSCHCMQSSPLEIHDATPHSRSWPLHHRHHILHQTPTPSTRHRVRQRSKTSQIPQELYHHRNIPQRRRCGSLVHLDTWWKFEVGDR